MTKEDLVKEIEDRILNKGYVFCDMGNKITIENKKLFYENCFGYKGKVSNKLPKSDLEFILANTIKSR